MTLSERISEELKTAMKAGEKLRLETLRTVRAQIIEFEKRGTGTVMTPEDELSVLLSAAKKRKEAIEAYRAAGRNDLADTEEKELQIISEFLPKAMGREEALAVVQRIVQETGASGAKDLGKVMPLAMKELKGKIEGKIVQELVKQQLG